MAEASVPQAEGALGDAWQWEEHFRDRERVWCRYDGIAAVISLAALFLAALRAGKELSLLEILRNLALVALALMVVIGRVLDPEGYLKWRNAAAVFLRVGVCSTSTIQAHALQMLSGRFYQLSFIRVAMQLMRVLIADHAGLLAFLGWAFPVGIMSHSLVQAICLFLVSRRNMHECFTPKAQHAAATALRDFINRISALTTLKPGNGKFSLIQLVPYPTERQVCNCYTLGIQLTLGFAAPILYWACSNARAAIEYAERHDISQDDRLYRMHRRIGRWLLPHQTTMQCILAAIVALLLASTTAGLFLLESQGQGTTPASGLKPN